MCRHLLIFPGRFQPSIFSASELNCRVRDGNGCTLTAIDTDLYQNPERDFALESAEETKSSCGCSWYGDPYEIRTRVAGVRGRSLRPLDQRAIWCTIRDSNPGHPD